MLNYKNDNIDKSEAQQIRWTNEYINSNIEWMYRKNHRKLYQSKIWIYKKLKEKKLFNMDIQYKAHNNKKKHKYSFIFIIE